MTMRKKILQNNNNTAVQQIKLKRNHKNKTKQRMGQVLRMMKYDHAGNVANAIPTPLSLHNAKLVFHRLDDGVMGGKSITNQEALNTVDTIHGLLFSGTIDTDGGGFTSIRSPLENSISSDAKGIKLKVRQTGGDDYLLSIVSFIHFLAAGAVVYRLLTSFTNSFMHSFIIRSTKAMAKHTNYY
jgi:hypothetical protein